MIVPRVANAANADRDAMHELSIALSIVDVAAEAAQRQGGARVVAVRLRLGPLSGVVREALLSAWELAREHSPLSDARLEIEDVPLVTHCPACDADVRPASVQMLCCPACGAATPAVVRGRELEIAALEVIDDGPEIANAPATAAADAPR